MTDRMSEGLEKMDSVFGKAQVKAEGTPITFDEGAQEPEPTKSAFIELLEYLESGEVVEGIVFGAFGWGDSDDDEGEAYGEDRIDQPIPKAVRGKLLTLEQAKPLMRGWSFDGGYGAPECYATYVWTNRRVIWVTQYDGSTGLDSMPRNPVDCVPGMPGG